MAPDATRAPAAPTVTRTLAAWRAAAAPHLAIAWRACWTSRALVWAAGLLAIAVWGVDAREADFDPAGLTRPYGSLGDALVAPGARWDATWYLGIAQDGYSEGPDTAFFPLYPLLVKVVGTLLLGSPLLAALLVSTGCFVAGLAAFHRLAELEVGPEAARYAVAALAFFPGALWFSAAYSEGLFLAVSVGAVLAARTDHWAAAGALGALAASTRSAGVLLVVPLALLWWSGARRPRDAAWIALVPAGLAAFCALLALEGIPADAPFRAQEVWHRELVGPLQGVADATVAAYEGVRQLLHGSPDRIFFTKAGGDPMEIARHNIMLYAFLLLAIPLLIGALRRLPLAHSAYASVALLLPLSTPVTPQPLMSLPRFLAVLYPLFLVLGLWMSQGPAWRARAVLATSAAGLAIFSAVFSTWHWVA